MTEPSQSSARSIRRYCRRDRSRSPTQSWRTFLTNHALTIWAVDLFVVQTLTCQTLYVRRIRSRVSEFSITPSPQGVRQWRAGHLFPGRDHLLFMNIV